MSFIMTVLIVITIKIRVTTILIWDITRGPPGDDNEFLEMDDLGNPGQVTRCSY
jgi:hypothetical protein